MSLSQRWSVGHIPTRSQPVLARSPLPSDDDPNPAYTTAARFVDEEALEAFKHDFLEVRTL